MSNAAIPSNLTAGVFENPDTGLRQCLTITGFTPQVALLSNGQSIAWSQHRGPCDQAFTGSHANADGSALSVQSARINATPGSAGAPYSSSSMRVIDGTPAAAQLAAGRLYK